MPLLFEPLTLRGLTISNRIWLAPMCQYSVEAEDGVPTDWHLVHLGARAQGGFGLVIAEATAVSPEGRISPQDTGLWNDDQSAAWKRITDFLHGQGAAAGIQLAHAGRKASTYRPFGTEGRGSVSEADGGWPTVGPSADAFPGFVKPTELTVDQIQQLIADFAEAAVRADQAGFDVVEVHGAHGYLIHEFLSPLSNHRTDSYGGDFAGRTLFLREVTEAVRAVWPEHKPLFVRLSATDWIDGGWDVAQSAQLAAELKIIGADLIDVSSGGNAPATIPLSEGYQVPFARQIRSDGGIPTAAVGLIVDPKHAEEILTTGDANAVLVGRVALREPSWPQRAAAELGLEPAEAPYPPQYKRGAWS